MSKRIMAIAAAGVLVLGAGGYYYAITSGLLGNEAGADAAEAAPEPEALGVVELEPFLTNIGDNGKRHARVSIKLAVSPEERAGEVLADPLAVARLRDMVLTLLTSKPVEELVSPDGKAALRKQIAREATKVIQPGIVEETLFSEFVVQ